MNSFLSSHLPFLLLFSSSITSLHHNNNTYLINQHYQITINMQNEQGQGVSHASDSALPQKVQEKVPSSVEHKVCAVIRQSSNTIHLLHFL